MNAHEDLQTQVGKPESIAVLAYFGVYLTYLFLRLENEMLHWLGLVCIPLLLLLVLRPKPSRSLRSLLASIGVRGETWRTWLGWAFLVGLGLSALQLVISRNAGEILAIISSGRAIYLLPLALILMFLMAGTTEEIFFRGILLTRLERLVGSRVGAVLISSTLFGLYHLPYAYLNPRWPSAGDWGASLLAAFGQGIPGGLILGWLYYASGRNLLASIVVHSMINALPAMRMIKFGGG